VKILIASDDGKPHILGFSYCTTPGSPQ
jgi:hypothetical protein